MYELSLLADFEIARRVGWALIHSLWQISIVVGIVLFLNLILAKQQSTVRYLICCVGMFFCVAIPVGTFAMLGSEMNSVTLVSSMPVNDLSNDVDAVRDSVETTSPSMNQEFIAIEADISSERVDSELTYAENADIEENKFSSNFSQSAKKSGTSSVLLPLGKRFSLELDAWLPTVFWTWIIGVIILALRPLTGILFIRRLRMQGRSSVPEYVSQMMIETCKQLRMNHAVEIAQSTLVEIPSVIGYFKPLVLLPVSAMTGLSESQLRAVIIHELAHIRRHDYLVNLMQTVVESLLFYHPLLWYLSAQIRTERENCCDDVVLKYFDDRRDYVCALIKLESRGQRQPVLAMNAKGGSLVKRVRRMSDQRNSRTGNAWLAGIIVLAGLIVLASIALISISRSTKQLPVQSEPVAKSSDVIDVAMRSTARVFPTTQSISGRVVDEAGLPIVGAVVMQYGKSDGYGYTQSDFLKREFETLNRAISDEFGNYTFKSFDFDRAVYTEIYFVHPNYVFRAGRNPFEAETVLSKGDDITGRILSQNGEPMEGVEVGVSVPSEEITGVSYGQTKTDRDGRFVLNHVGINGVASLKLKIPGRYTQQLYWYSDDRVNSATETAQRYPEETVFGQDFEFRIRQPQSVKLSVIAEDTKRPIDISRAVYRHYLAGREGDETRLGSDEIQTENNMVKYDYLKTGINRFWLFPKDDAQYPPVFIDVSLADNEKPVSEIEIAIPRGATVIGHVADNITGKPINDALITFLPHEPEKLANAGIIARRYCRTRDDGSFSVVLPAASFDVQVVGDCGDYKTIPDSLHSSSPRAADGTSVENTPQSKLPEELTKRIELDSAESIDAGIFRLERGTKATGVVLDSTGQPVANVGYVIMGNRDINLSTRFGVAGADGRFEIGSLFTNALLNTTADVFFFNVERGRSKLVAIAETDSRDLRVTLDPLPAIRGRVIDATTGLPLSGVGVASRFGPMSDATLGATTDETGSYLVEHLPRDRIDCVYTKDGYQLHLETFPFLENDQDQILKDVPEIRLVKTLAYGRPEKLDVIGLSPAETINELVDHIAKELSKLPDRDPSESRWSSDDPDTVFKTQVTKDVGAVVDRLLNDNDDVDFQVAATLKIFSALSTSKGGKTISHTLPTSRMHKILLKNLDRNEVFASYSEFRFGFSAIDEIEIVLDNNQSPMVRLWTIQNQILELEHLLVQSAHMRGRQTGFLEFEKIWGLMEKAWRVGLDEFSDEQVRGEPFQNKIRASMTRVVDQIEQMPHDEEHLNAIKAVISALD